MADKPLSQQYHERVEELKAGGMTNAAAVRAVAEEFGKQENAIRGGIHQWKARHGEGGGTTPRRRRGARLSPDDLVSSAKNQLQMALELIDQEVEAAKANLEDAQSQYDRVVASVAKRKEAIEAKLKAFS